MEWCSRRDLNPTENGENVRLFVAKMFPEVSVSVQFAPCGANSLIVKAGQLNGDEIRILPLSKCLAIPERRDSRSSCGLSFTLRSLV